MDDVFPKTIEASITDLLQVAKRVRKDAGRAGQAAEDTGEGECETEAKWYLYSVCSQITPRVIVSDII
jgi:hypothetical protein